MTNTLEEIRDTFLSLDNWEDRYHYVIELGKDLPAYPEELKDPSHRIQGCVSQVWLAHEAAFDAQQPKDPILTFKADSDAFIVKGLVYLVVTFYSGKRASEIVKHPVTDFLKEISLQENLSAQRANGLKALIMHIHNTAQHYCPPGASA